MKSHNNQPQARGRNKGGKGEDVREWGGTQGKEESVVLGMIELGEGYTDFLLYPQNVLKKRTTKSALNVDLWGNGLPRRGIAATAWKSSTAWKWQRGCLDTAK